MSVVVKQWNFNAAGMDGEEDDPILCRNGHKEKTVQEALRHTTGTNEAIVSTLCHVTLLCFYIGVHKYDTAVFAEHQAVWYRGGGSYGGRWQALTYICLVSLC